MHKGNRLQHETSPYLLQHANNPVDWYPWGEEALNRAKEEDKPILVSIGYSSCHWCHVMERESFEVGDIAQIMNEHFDAAVSELRAIFQAQRLKQDAQQQRYEGLIKTLLG